MEANAAEANAAEANTATTLAPAANTTEANAATITLATEVNAGLFGLLKTHLLKGPGDRPPLCLPHAPNHWCNACRQTCIYQHDLKRHELLSSVLPKLLSSCKLTTLCTASQSYAIAAGWRDEQAAMVQIDCFDAAGTQNAPVAKHRGPLQVIATFTESSTRTSEGVTCLVDGEDVSSTTVLESAVHLHLISEEGGLKEGPRPCRPLLALRLLGGEVCFTQALTPPAHAFVDADCALPGPAGTSVPRE